MKNVMKVVLTVAVFCVVISVIAAKTKEEKKQMFKGLMMNCSKDLGLPLSEDKLEKKECPQDDDMKCILECAMERLGLVADGQYSLVGAKQSIEFGVDDPAMKKKALDVAESCEKTVGKVSGKCAAGAAICECVKSAGLFSEE